eukprot:403374529
MADVLEIDDSRICAYAGYVNTNNSAIYYQLFTSAQSQQFSNSSNITKPLTIWINSGFGTSLLIGNLLEVGPFTINQNGTLTMKESSWVDETNLLFFDYPHQSGFSRLLTENNQNEQQGSTTIRQMGRKIILAGQSYAANIITDLATLMVDLHQKGESQFVIRGIIMFNPMFDPISQRQGIEKIAQHLGILDSQQVQQIQSLQDQCQQESLYKAIYPEQAQYQSISSCIKVLQYLQEVSGNMSLSDTRTLESKIPHQLSSIYKMFTPRSNMQTEKLYNALNILTQPKFFVIFDRDAFQVSQYAYGSTPREQQQKLSHLLNTPIPIFFISSMFDNQISHQETEEIIDQIKYRFHNQYQRSPKLFYYYNKTSSSGQDSELALGGYLKKTWPLHHLTAREVGHFLSQENIQLSNSIIKNMLEISTLNCDHPDQSSKCKIQDETFCQKYLNNCNNQGICLQNGQCYCFQGYYGVDCGVFPTHQRIVQINNMAPMHTEYMIVNQSDPDIQQTIIIKGDNIEVMAQINEIPTKSNNIFKSQGTYIVLDTQSFFTHLSSDMQEYERKSKEFRELEHVEGVNIDEVNHNQDKLFVSIQNLNRFPISTTEEPLVQIDYQDRNSLMKEVRDESQMSVLLMILAIAVGVMALVNACLFCKLKGEKEKIYGQFQ